jgi:hypothetical protein
MEGSMRWNWERRFVRQVLATLIQARRRDLIHDFLVLAMSLDTAKKLLGFEETESPSQQDVEKAWKRKALEHHPDRGGDAEMMKQINIAHDVLTGKQRPDRGGGSSRPAPGGQPYDGPFTYEPPPEKKVVVTWDEAARKAGVPTSGIEWKMKTDSGFGGYGDKTQRGFVLYGQTSSEHVFVGIYSRSVDPNMYTNTTVDVTEMWVERVPLNKPLATVGPKVIRDLWRHFTDVKGYNNKVFVLAPGTKFEQRIKWSTSGRKVPFKTAMEQMGESAAPSGAPKGKIDIVLELDGGLAPSYPADYGASLVVNGRPYKLSDASNKLLWKARFYRFVWGPKGYYYGGSSKNLTRLKKAKKALTFLAEKLQGEPTALMEALQAAADRAK